MTTLVDYLPRLPELRLNTFQQTLGIVWAVIFFAWAAVSTFVVLANGGSFFSNDPECTTFMKLTRKHSSPLWRKITFWTVRLEIVLLVLFVISLFIWNEKHGG
jgi:hypothetical protein